MARDPKNRDADHIVYVDEIFGVLTVVSAFAIPLLPALIAAVLLRRASARGFENRFALWGFRFSLVVTFLGVIALLLELTR